MNEQETIADIIAEARDKYTVHECNQCSWRKCCSKGFGSEECGKFRESIWLKLGIEDGYFTQLLDRLEAAHKRERGDCAKLREALKHIKDRLPHMLQYMRVHWEDASAGGYFDELMLVIDAALAATEKEGGAK